MYKMEKAQEVDWVHACYDVSVRDWSLITGRGGLQNGKIAGPKPFAPPPPHQDRVKLFTPPLLKSGNFSCPPYNMAKTSSYRVKTTSKLFLPPFSMAKICSAFPSHLHVHQRSLYQVKTCKYHLSTTLAKH